MNEEKKEFTEKPLDKMTVTELREIALEIPGITGVHGMKKPELLEAVKAAKGIACPGTGTCSITGTPGLSRAGHAQPHRYDRHALLCSGPGFNRSPK